ncbi:MAG TPA: hypothetical protein VME92_05045 [Acetobacteraceae bacterium]|nr:hypothetical protein [Acetobacteraceae bacterium]
MRTNLVAAALLSAGMALLAVDRARAHVVAGDRVFPVTLTFDDPGVGDEVTLPQFVYAPGPGGQNEYQFQWEYDKTITPTTAVIYNQGWDVLQQPGSKTRTGFENVVLTGKWQSITLPQSETVVSLGVIREFAGGYATQGIGGDATGATAPTGYFGQGLGALPIGLLRPLAVTGELSYIIPDHRLNTAGDNNGQPFAWNGGLSVQYSIPYLQQNVKHFGMPDLIGRLIPLVELDWFSPAAGPAHGLPETLTVAPGVIYLGDTYQVGLEALIPGNKAAGPHVGAILQVHFFLDDIFPHSLGRPIFN